MNDEPVITDKREAAEYIRTKRYSEYIKGAWVQPNLYNKIVRINPKNIKKPVKMESMKKDEIIIIDSSQGSQSESEYQVVRKKPMKKKELKALKEKKLMKGI